MKLQFLGANRQVTGSRYCLEAGDTKVLIDCGMFQEREYLDRNWEPSLIPPKDIHALVLTHAHLDHCGLIPRLVHEGFRGPILTTPASADLTESGPPRRRRDSDGRRGLQAEAAPQGRPPRQTPGNPALHTQRRRPHDAALPDRPVRASPPASTTTCGHLSRRRAHPRLGDRRARGPRERRNRGGSSFPATWASGTSRSSAIPRSSRRPTSSSWNRPTATATTSSAKTPRRNWPT